MLTPIIQIEINHICSAGSNGSSGDGGEGYDEGEIRDPVLRAVLTQAVLCVAEVHACLHTMRCIHK